MDTQDLEQYLLENYAKLGQNEIVAHTGMKWWQIKERVGRMRRKGISVPHRRPFNHSIPISIDNVSFISEPEAMLTYNRQLLVKAIMKNRDSYLSVMLLAYNLLLLLSDKESKE